MIENNKNTITRDYGILDGDHDLIPMVKWLVGFRIRNSYGSENITIREFRCSGYYGAFEKVQWYAHKTDMEVLWFEEKRLCEEELAYAFHLPLGSFCTFCDGEHTDEDSVPCQVKHCKSIFCSKRCYEDHRKLKHIDSDSR